MGDSDLIFFCSNGKVSEISKTLESEPQLYEDDKK